MLNAKHNITMNRNAKVASSSPELLIAEKGNIGSLVSN